MKYLKFIIPIIVVAAIWGYLTLNKSSVVEGIKLVPSNAIYIFQTEEPIQNWETFSSHSIWQILKKHPTFTDIEVDANFLDTLITDNASAFDILGSRNLIISAHETTSKSYDFLFFIELEPSVNSGLVLTTLSKVLSNNEYQVTKSTFGDYEVLKGTDNFGDQISFTQIGTQLVISFNESLVNSVIETANHSSFVEESDFQKLYKSISSDGVGQLFIQYDYLDELFSCYMSDGLEPIEEVSSLFKYTGFDCNVTDKQWKLEGVTLIDSSKSSVVNAVLKSGKSQNTAGGVLSNRTAWFMSFNYEDFSTFRKNIESVRTVDASLQNYEKNIRRIESLLKISIEDDLLSWIGNEVTIAQLKKNLSYDSDEAAVLLLKTGDVEEATKHLDHISDQVKKRTPAKFKSILYHNYKIQYLDIKGFFKTFFGKAFDKIDKPYYTIINDYVVFCNSPYTIVGLIEDYENDRNLSNSSSYQRFVDRSKDASITLYASPINLYPALLPLMDIQSKKTLSESKSYFQSFESFGVSLVANKKHFKTTITLAETETNDEDETTSDASIRELYSQFAEERDINSNSFSVEWIEDGMYVKKYPGTDKTQIEGKTTRGVLDGSYTEYHINGERKSSGKYKMGRKKGTWKYYNEQGDLIDKKKY